MRDGDISFGTAVTIHYTTTDLYPPNYYYYYYRYADCAAIAVNCGGKKKKISERRFKAKKKIPKPPPYYVCMYIDIYLYVAMAPRTNSRLYKSEKRSKTAESIYYSKYVK